MGSSLSKCTHHGLQNVAGENVYMFDISRIMHKNNPFAR